MIISPISNASKQGN